MPDPATPVHWVDPSGTQFGPEPWDTVLQRLRAGQIPPTTNVWWEGAESWTPISQVPGAEPPEAAPAPTDTAGATPLSASAALMAGLTDQELDDEFIALVGRSWEMYKETEYASSIDETMLGGVITALVDCGFVLIDLETAGALPVVSSTDPAVTEVGSTPTAAHHQLRFEEPDTQARVTVSIQHLTPDVASARMIGQRASAIIGYGERVREFQKVGQAVRQEVASTFVVSPEPGTVTFDADLSSGYVYAQIDLLLELDRYVAEDLAVDHDLLRRHLAAVVYTLKTFVQSRFGS
jgi:hypothetical protein